MLLLLAYLPAILPLSSMRKTVSNCVKNAYGESAVVANDPGTGLFVACGEYAGGAELSTAFGRRVGTVVANSFDGDIRRLRGEKDAAP